MNEKTATPRRAPVRMVEVTLTHRILVPFDDETPAAALRARLEAAPPFMTSRPVVVPATEAAFWAREAAACQDTRTAAPPLSARDRLAVADMRAGLARIRGRLEHWTAVPEDIVRTVAADPNGAVAVALVDALCEAEDAAALAVR